MFVAQAKGASGNVLAGLGAVVKYVFGNDLSRDLAREALALDHNRFTGEHRPAWLDGPNVDRWRRNGTPDFEDDAAWLANTEFPVAGRGHKLHLARNGQKPRTHYAHPPRVAPGQIVTPSQAERMAVALAKGTGLAVWVCVEGYRTGDMSFHRPQTGLIGTWAVATPEGKVY